MAEPSLHLIKLCVGLARLSELQAFQRERAGRKDAHTGRVEFAHITRHMPKRAAELLAGGSLFWVMSGFIVARQKLLEFRAITVEGKQHCAIIYDGTVIPVEPRPRRPFQGWRYLEAKDAPPDIAGADQAGVHHAGELPPEMQRELARLGLL